MIRLRLLMLFVGVVAVGASAQSKFAAKVSLNTDTSFVVKSLNIRDDYLYAPSGKVLTSLAKIESVEFRFSTLNLKMCETLYYSGRKATLEGLLQEYVAPLASYRALPTNLGPYFIWLLRVQYWKGDFEGAEQTVAWLLEMDNQGHADLANLYYTILLLDQKEVEAAEEVFEQVMDLEGASAPMVGYIRAYLAVSKGDDEQAIRAIAKMVAYHSRSQEWMAPTTVFEAELYLRNGQLRKAEAVANELMIAYPDTQWSERGREIKNEVTGQ